MSPEQEPKNEIDSSIDMDKLVEQNGEDAGRIKDPELARVGAGGEQSDRDQVLHYDYEHSSIPLGKESGEFKNKLASGHFEQSGINSMVYEIVNRAIKLADGASEDKVHELCDLINKKFRDEVKNNTELAAELVQREANIKVDSMIAALNTGEKSVSAILEEAKKLETPELPENPNEISGTGDGPESPEETLYRTPPFDPGPFRK